MNGNCVSRLWFVDIWFMLCSTKFSVDSSIFLSISGGLSKFIFHGTTQIEQQIKHTHYEIIDYISRVTRHCFQ